MCITKKKKKNHRPATTNLQKLRKNVQLVHVECPVCPFRSSVNGTAFRFPILNMDFNWIFWRKFVYLYAHFEQQQRRRWRRHKWQKVISISLTHWNLYYLFCMWAREKRKLLTWTNTYYKWWQLGFRPTKPKKEWQFVSVEMIFNIRQSKYTSIHIHLSINKYFVNMKCARLSGQTFSFHLIFYCHSIVCACVPHQKLVRMDKWILMTKEFRHFFSCVATQKTDHLWANYFRLYTLYTTTHSNQFWCAIRQ